MRRIIQHLGGLNPAAKAFADYYGLEPRSAQRNLCRWKRAETKMRQGTIDHLEDFLEYIEREVEAA